MTGEARRSLGRLALVAILLAVLMTAVAMNSPASPGRTAALPVLRTSAAPAGLYFDYIVIILLENHNLCDVYYGNATGSPCGTSPTGGAYETSLADTYGIPLNDHYCNVNPSLPNYLCLSGGSDFGCSGYDGNPNSNTCTGVAWNSENIVDRLVGGGLTWKAYMEDMTSNCQGTGSGNYAVRHDPFVYYNDIVSNSSRCSRVVPAGPSAGSDSTFLGDLNSTSTASNYMWLTPNTLNDAHDTSVAYADAYLANLVPQILNSPVFTSQRAALFITYDEGYGPPTFALWAGPVVKQGYSSSTLYSHFSLLSTIEANWNLPYLNATNDGAAPDMSEFFTSATPDFSLTANPSSVWFPPGGSTNSNITVHPKSGFTGTVALSAASNPSGVTTTCTPSNVTAGGTSSCALSASTQGNYTVTITGVSGNLTHTVSIQVTVSTAVPPVTTMQLAGTMGSGGWYVTAVTVTLSSTPSGGNVVIHYRVDSGALQTYSNPFAVYDGSHTLEYYATNGTEPPETQHHTATLKVDTAPPFITPELVGATGANGWYVSGVRVTLNATDNASGVATVSYQIDSGSTQPFSTPFDVTNGIHTVVYSATDVAGLLSASGSLTLKVDTVPPVFQSLWPSGVVNQSSVTISWTATDVAGINKYQVRVDNGSYQDVGLNTSLRVDLADGPHTVQVLATDAAGLTNAAVIQFQVSTASGGPNAWPLLLPLFAALGILAAFGIAFIVLRRRQRRRVREGKQP